MSKKYFWTIKLRPCMAFLISSPANTFTSYVHEKAPLEVKYYNLMFILSLHDAPNVTK